MHIESLFWGNSFTNVIEDSILIEGVGSQESLESRNIKKYQHLGERNILDSAQCFVLDAIEVSLNGSFIDFGIVVTSCVFLRIFG
jgi:hypothetical protein